jgi:ribosomal protein S18 acetylase RimI-like enzyme
MTRDDLQVRPLDETERQRLKEHLIQSWGATTIVSRGRVHDAARLPAFVCFERDELAGFATFRIHDQQCELVTLDALRENRGVGSTLLAAVIEHAEALGCRRLWLITTNDNARALGFYERRGLRLIAVHAGAVDEARRLKPSIPLHGADGIPIHDELELELELDPTSA